MDGERFNKEISLQIHLELLCSRQNRSNKLVRWMDGGRLVGPIWGDDGYYFTFFC